MAVEHADREAIRKLVERIPDDEIGTAHRFLEFLAIGPVARALLTAEPDDEPVTEQDQFAIRGADAEIRDGKLVDHDEVLREFGLK